MNDLIETLIDETLEYGRPSGDGCFVTNEASKELCQQGERALSPIEVAIRNRLVLDSNRSVDHDELLGRHPGLLNLWMAYYQIAGDSEVARIVPFLRSLDGPLLATAILAMNPTWPDENEKATIPVPILQFIREVAVERCGCVAEVARYYLP
jgi:hypothetical protein